MDKDRLIEQLRLHEGVEHKVYKDTEGIETIGVGRNLRDRGLSDDEIDYLLANDIAICEQDLDKALPWWRGLDDVRQRVLCDLIFNLGLPRLLGFKKTLEHIKNEAWHDASIEMLDSKCARQVGKRADRLSEMIRTGEDYS